MADVQTITTVKELRKALNRVTKTMDAADEYAHVYVRLQGALGPYQDEVVLTGKVTVDSNGCVVIHAKA